MSGHCADRIAIMLRGWVVEMGSVELQVGCKFASRCPQASKYPAYLVPEQHYFHGGHYDDRHQPAL